MKKIITTVVVSMFLCSPVLHAKMDRDGPRDGGARVEERMKKMFDQLDLSDDQKKMLEANRNKNKESKKALREEMRANMAAIGEELKKPDLDMAKVEDLRAKGKELFNKMADQRFNAILEVRKILTKEQFLKFTEQMEKQKEGRREWRKEE